MGFGSPVGLCQQKAPVDGENFIFIEFLSGGRLFF